MHLDVEEASHLPPASERGGGVVLASVAMMVCGLGVTMWAVAQLMLGCMTGSWLGVSVGFNVRGQPEDLLIAGILAVVVLLQILFTLVPMALGANSARGGWILFHGGSRRSIRLAAVGLPVAAALMTASSLASVVLMFGFGCLLLLPATVGFPLSLFAGIAGVLASAPASPDAMDAPLY